MMYSGFYGPNGSTISTGAPLASQFVNGVLTVPIANRDDGQPLPAWVVLECKRQWFGPPGSGTFIGLIGMASNGPTGNGTYNLLGGPSLLDPGVFIPFAEPHPEPSTFILAGLGAVGMWYVRRLHGK